jgi:hypothetical protein
MTGFTGMGHNGAPKAERWKDCECLTCGKEIHHLGIMRHRAMHRDRNEDCRIVFSDGRCVSYQFSKKATP